MVPPKLTPMLYPTVGTYKKSLCDATGMRASVTLFRYVADWRLYLCSITGAPELGYLRLRAIARSTRRSIRLLRFCLAFRTSAWLSGNRFEVYSSSSAFLDIVGQYSMTEEEGCQGFTSSHVSRITSQYPQHHRVLAQMIQCLADGLILHRSDEVDVKEILPGASLQWT